MTDISLLLCVLSQLDRLAFAWLKLVDLLMKGVTDEFIRPAIPRALS